MMVKAKKSKKNDILAVIGVVLGAIIVAAVVLGITSIPKGEESSNVYAKYAGLYHSETGIKHCVTRKSCLTSTEIYLSDIGLCAVGATKASSNCHWKQNGKNSISIKYDTSDSFSYESIELVDNGIIVEGVLFTKVR